MPFYQQLGKIPPKRHTQFRKEDGSLFSEHLMGNKGFVGLSSNLYHHHAPTKILKRRIIKELNWIPESNAVLQPRHLYSSRLERKGTPTSDRTPLMFNSDLAILMSQPERSDKNFYRNGQGDELVYVAAGSGTLETTFGNIPFGKGDYLVIPRAVIHRYILNDEPAHFLIFESAGYIRTPERYRNEHGQLMEHSPFCERDIRTPQEAEVFDEKGEFTVVTKKDNKLHEIVYQYHPFDVVGWDGYYYPWAFNINDFEPIVGSLHQPPPVHQTFEGDGFVICSFVPRLFDFHPDAIPAPYNHSNVMSDEVIYYASDEFMSRENVEFGSITLHPDGIVHGPHPGTVEKSIGAERTDEIAVMADTFKPLHVAREALEIEDKEYYRSWLEEE